MAVELSPNAQDYTNDAVGFTYYAPAVLGVHTITLNQTTTIDGGGLRLWAGAAHHDDPTTDAAAELLRELEQRYASQALGDGLAERAERVSSVGASGSRRIGGPFLRAALGTSDDFKHVWILWADMRRSGTTKRPVPVRGRLAGPREHGAPRRGTRLCGREGAAWRSGVKERWKGAV